MRAGNVTVNMDFDGSRLISLLYSIDNDFSGVLEIKLPYRIPVSKRQISLVGIIGSFVVAKLCLAKEITLQFPCSNEIIETGLSILELLYDVRCFRDRRDLVPFPKIYLANSTYIPPHAMLYGASNKKVHLLWSGGKDSTLSLLLLRQNAYEVKTIHSTVNVDSVNAEMKAVNSLGDLLNQKTDYLGLNFSSLVEIGKKYSNSFGVFPDYNSIPHGRDFLLLAVMSVLSSYEMCNNICSGSEYELYSKTVNYQGKTIYRHDSQSERGYYLLSNFLSNIYSMPFYVFSPVAHLTEYKSFDMLVKKRFDLLSNISSCFWGNWCGQCFKCFRYFLIQTDMSREIIDFISDPLDSTFASKYVENWQDRSLPYWEEVNYCLYRMTLDSDLVKSYPLVRQYKEKASLIMRLQLPLLEEYLFNNHDVLLFPPGFKPLTY